MARDRVLPASSSRSTPRKPLALTIVHMAQRAAYTPCGFVKFVARLAVLILCIPLPSHGDDSANAILRQSEILQREQQELLRQDQERARKSVPAVGGADLRGGRESHPTEGSGACHQIDELAIEGAPMLRAALVQRLTRDFVGRCLGIGDIEQILGLITQDYMERGYVTARAYLPAQDLNSRRLRILVLEGEIEGYRLEDDGAKRIFVPGAFPSGPGDKLNLRDLEQGIDQINRLAANHATVDIEPGSVPGKSVVVIRNPRSFPIHLALTYDNLGNKSTGKESRSATLILDSPLGLNERWMFTNRTSTPHESQHNSASNSLDYWMPLGNYSLGFNLSRSDYVNVLTLASGGRLATEGETISRTLNLERLLYRDQASKLGIFARAGSQETRNFIGGFLMTANSRKLSPLDVGATAYTLAWGGLLTSQLAYSQGLKAFGALEDEPGQDKSMPRAQFSKINLDLGYNRRFTLGKQDFDWSAQAVVQYARMPLYGSQQLLIGSTSTVRGFIANSLSGDRGYYLRNELAVPWQLNLAEETLGGRWYVGYDLGRVVGVAPGSPEGSLSGSTFGLALQWRGANIEFSQSRPHRLAPGMKREDSQLLFRLSYAI